MGIHVGHFYNHLTVASWPNIDDEWTITFERRTS